VYEELQLECGDVREVFETLSSPLERVHGEQELEFGDFQEVFEILPSPVERDFVQVADDDDAGCYSKGESQDVAHTAGVNGLGNEYPITVATAMTNTGKMM